jgi:2-hydroxychromene-2-carboxylate isomerase
MSQTPRLYFSFRSPYSWLALERLRRAVPDLFERFDMVPYWDPDEVTARMLKECGAEFHYQQMSRAKHRYLLVDSKRLAQRLGLAMAWPVDIDPWWEVPHLGWLRARQQGQAERCYDVLVEARWSRGENISDPDVFARVTTDAGLNGADLLAATDDDEVRAEGVAGLVAAYEQDVFGIPYMCSGRQRFWGVDRVDMFLEALAADGQVVAVEAPESVPVGSYDRDTGGGCG